MINLSVNEINNLIVKPIDYLSFESEQREKECSILYDFIKIRANKELFNTVLKPYNSETRYQEELFEFYNKNNDNSFEIKSAKEKELIEYEKKMLKYIRDYNKSFENKIEGFMEKWGFEYEYIYNKILEDELFSLNFVKDPGKQTFHQHLAKEWIERIPLVEKMVEPINHGDNAIYIYNGVIKTGKELSGQKVGKSIDFIWEYTYKHKTLKFYATHKHTKISGGSQDNQFEDVCLFQEQAQKCWDDNIYLLSITDGQYYLDKYTKMKTKNLEMNKITFLNKHYGSSRNKATNCLLLVNDIAPVIKEWLNSNFSQIEIQDELNKIDTVCKKYSF